MHMITLACILKSYLNRRLHRQFFMSLNLSSHMIQRICFTKWHMLYILYLDLKTFQGHSFIDIFSKSKLWYKVVILTKISPNLADILEILKLYTHLSTNLSNCPYCVTFINHRQKIRYFGIILQPGRPEIVLDPIFFTKSMKLLGSMYHC